MTDGLLNGATIVPLILLGIAWAIYLGWPRIADGPRPGPNPPPGPAETSQQVGDRRFLEEHES